MRPYLERCFLILSASDSTNCPNLPPKLLVRNPFPLRPWGLLHLCLFIALTLYYYTGRATPRQIGLARLITDKVSFAFLTDVYVLKEFQGKGLGTWLIECLDETLNSWPELKRTLLIARSGGKFYQEKLGVQLYEQGKNGLEILTKRGPGSVLQT